MPRVFVVSALILVALSIADQYLAGNPRLPGFGGDYLRLSKSSAAQLSVEFGMTFLRMLVSAYIAVAVHRFVLLEEATRGISNIFTAHFWSFLAWSVAIAIVLTVVDLPIPAILRIAGIGLSVFVLFRLVLTFPAIAVGARIANPVELIRQSVLRTRGNALRIFFAYVVAILPVIVALFGYWLLTFILFDVAEASGADSRTKLIQIIAGMFGHMVAPVLGVFATACAASVASCAYGVALEREGREVGV